MTRVLHVVPLVDDRGTYGGALTVAVNQCLELRRRGHDARITGAWLGAGRPPHELGGVPVRLLPPPAGAPARAVGPVAPALLLGGVRRWVGEHAGSFEVAHLHVGRDLAALALADVLRRVDVPYVVQTHGPLPSPARTAGSGPARGTRRASTRLLGARQVFVHTPEERDSVARVTGSTDHVDLLRDGVVLPDRVPAGQQGPATDVLFLGRLAPARRVLAFAAAAERLVEDGVDATFSVVGPDGGDLRELRRFISERPHLAGRLRYEGALPHDRAVDRLRRADLFVSPSVEDQATPMSLLEALAAGIPAICTTACGLAGTLAREHAAIVANPTDDALYGAMRRLLVDRSARARLSACAAATAASLFTMTPVAEVLEQAYGGAGDELSTDAGPVRPRILWVADDPTDAHVEVWDALRAGTRLTVALLAGARRTGAAERTADRTADRASPELHARGYPVLRVVPGRAARRSLHDLVRDRPDVVVLDARSSGPASAVRRWARRAGAQIVVADPQAGPGAAAARAWTAPGHAGRVDLDLRPVRSSRQVPDTVVDLPDDHDRDPGRTDGTDRRDRPS